jgi:glycerol-3-phosphate dehydrogenase
MSPRAQRHARLDRLAREPLDLLVVGGGITGAGVARDAALRGLKVAVVEKGDWGRGTSSRSSKLVHGGLRYLENLELGLVFESLRERRLLRKLAPNLCWPQAFVFPVYRGDANSLFKVNLGLWLYDSLALFRTFKMHRRLNPKRTIELAPGLEPDGLTGSVHYYDCRTDDGRLCLANMLDAERLGAIAASYVAFVRPLFDGPTVVGAELEDQLDGNRLTVACRHVVVAAGPWTDTIPEAAGAGKLLRPTRGVHLVVDRTRLPIKAVVVMAAVQDGRVVFVIPFGNATYVGTTDTDHDGDTDQVRATSDDIEYLLATANAYFPSARLVPEDVRATWAGLRPLIRSDAESPYQTSREHACLSDPRGITTVAGGKLTTYRVMAAEVVDAALEALARRGPMVARPCATGERPLDPELGPMPEEPTEGETLALCLWRNHGSRGALVQARLQAHPGEAERVTPELPHVMAQVAWAVLGEQALTLEDVLLRRLPVFYRAQDQGLAAAPRVAKLMAELLGEDEAWITRQIGCYSELVERSQRGARALAAASHPMDPVEEPARAEKKALP